MTGAGSPATRTKKNGAGPLGPTPFFFVLVAGVGFEPTTSGL